MGERRRRGSTLTGKISPVASVVAVLAATVALTAVILEVLHLPHVTATAPSGAGVGVCWRLKRRDGSCGRLIRADVTREECCSGRHRRGWGTAAAASSSFVTHTSDSIRISNTTSELSSAASAATCMPCITSCAGVRCGEDRKCVVRCGAPRCVCSPQCHLKHKEAVCGTDGRTYKSECHLLKRACRKKRRLLVAHYGPCQTCSGVRCGGGKKCVLDEQMTPRCVRCPSSCPPQDKPRPICAADQRTYVSPCHLKRASCRAAAEIPRAYKGPCREDATCSSVRCWRDQRCLTRVDGGQPQCTSCGSLDSCKPSSRPVCASNGRIYPSWCAFRHEACRSGRALIPTLHQHCASNHTEVDDCNKQHFKPKKSKQRRRQDLHEKDLRHHIVAQRIFQGVAETAGAATLAELKLEGNTNNVESGGASDVDGSTRKAKINRALISEKMKKRKRRRKRRRRNCKMNRKRTRKERERTREEQTRRVEGE